MPPRYQRHTKASIEQTLRNLAQQLGKKTLTKKDVQTVLPLSVVNYHFGSLGNALEAAGLERADRSSPHFKKLTARHTLSEEELFLSLRDCETKLGHEPNYSEYNTSGKYSVQPFRKRFGTWENVMARYRKWKADLATADEPRRTHEGGTGLTNARTGPDSPPTRGRSGAPAPYGAVINFRGLHHAPTNEQGVVYLFGMVSRELGFNIEALQSAFPDCEAKRLDPQRDLWHRARIEFEFKSSHFREHGHDANECDFIVCWQDDWDDCPISVIELKKEIERLPSK